jgi:hypothetical protein
MSACPEPDAPHLPQSARGFVFGNAVAGERMILCRIKPGARIVSPDGGSTPLLTDPRVATDLR